MEIPCTGPTQERSACTHRTAQSWCDASSHTSAQVRSHAPPNAQVVCFLLCARFVPDKHSCSLFVIACGQASVLTFCHCLWPRRSRVMRAVCVRSSRCVHRCLCALGCADVHHVHLCHGPWHKGSSMGTLEAFNALPTHVDTITFMSAAYRETPGFTMTSVRPATVLQFLPDHVTRIRLGLVSHCMTITANATRRMDIVQNMWRVL